MNDNYVDTIAASKPKSNQLNADDLISSNRIIKITGVQKGNAEQPIAVRFEGDENKPWFPCKSVIRILRVLYTDDSRMWVGQSLELFNDRTVKWAGVQVGGIRIASASGIANDTTILITENRKTRKPVTIKRLNVESPVIQKQQSSNLVGSDSQIFQQAVDFIRSRKGNLDQICMKYQFTPEAFEILKGIQNEAV